MTNYDYFLHYIKRFQDNNFDSLSLVSGNKGSGKSTTAIILAREYIDKFGFICPHCKNEFYKNIYSIKKSETNKPIFYIPDYVKEDKALQQLSLRFIVMR